MNALAAQLTSITQKAEQAFSRQESGPYAALAHALTESEAQLREHMQTISGDTAMAVLRKLERDQPLTQEELALIRAWVVGDAEAYATHEQNMPEWLLELRRLVEQLRKADWTTADVTDILRLRALLRDAIRVVWDVHNYLEQQERVALFAEATQELDRDERALLAGFLRSKLLSKTM